MRGAEKKFTKAGFVRAYVVPALFLFAIPAASYGFGRYANRDLDEQFLEAVTQSLDKDPEVTSSRRGEILGFYTQNPPSFLCSAGDEGRKALPPEYVSAACNDHQQFSWIALASLGSIGLGVFSLLVVIACVALSFASRQLQYLSFVAGWNFLRIVSALQVLLQGFLAVMLSFWVTAFFFERYSIKLIAVVGVMAVLAAFAVIVAIFKKPADRLDVEGEPLSREKSPALWARIEALCSKLGTQAPDHIVGGIDDNFFVTEHPVTLQSNDVLKGRTLFVSLSLLKRLDKSEADAILAHEMAHFSGGDTLYSKKLAPLLSRYRAYMVALHAGGLSRPIFSFMLFYWSMFQISLGRDNRQRELRADKIAAENTSPTSIANALYKVSAYSSYRARVEQGLFERNRRHSQLDIAMSVAVGFTEYAQGPGLADDLHAEAFPHPFDSHPALEVRLASVGVQPIKEGIAEIVIATAAQTWFDEIGDAERIEGALWDAYEARFKAAHEESLAYRYLPSTPEERVHVERFFPPLEIAGKEPGTSFSVDCVQLKYGEWTAPVAWSSVTNIKAEDAAFRGKILTFSVQTSSGSEKLKLPLRKVAEKEEAVIAVLNRYYGRYLTAKANEQRAVT